MTKADLCARVQERAGNLTEKQALELIEKVLVIIKTTLAGGENVKLSGFGNFVLRNKEERLGRNPATGKPLPLAARRVVTFKASDKLRSGMNR